MTEALSFCKENLKVGEFFDRDVSTRTTQVFVHVISKGSQIERFDCKNSIFLVNPYCLLIKMDFQNK